MAVNCDNNFKDECKPIKGNIDEINFFKLELYIPPEYKFNPYTKEMNKHNKIPYTKPNVNDKALYTFISKAIISREQTITNENFENFKSSNTIVEVIAKKESK